MKSKSRNQRNFARQRWNDVIPHHKLYILTAQNFGLVIASFGAMRKQRSQEITILLILHVKMCKNSIQKVTVHSGICLCTSDCIQNRNGGNMVREWKQNCKSRDNVSTQKMHSAEKNASTLTVVQSSHIRST